MFALPHPGSVQDRTQSINMYVPRILNLFFSQLYGSDQVIVWIQKGEKSHSKSISKPFFFFTAFWNIWILKSSCSRKSPLHATAQCRVKPWYTRITTRTLSYNHQTIHILSSNKDAKGTYPGCLWLVLGGCRWSAGRSAHIWCGHRWQCRWTCSTKEPQFILRQQMMLLNNTKASTTAKSQQQSSVCL